MEAFLQPDDSDPLIYKELEVSPNGFWIDLDIDLDDAEQPVLIQNPPTPAPVTDENLPLPEE